MSSYKEYYQRPHSLSDYDIVLDTEDDDTFDDTEPALVQIYPATGDFAQAGVDYNGATAKIWLQNGTAETDYWVRVRLKTTLGRYVNEEFEVKIRQGFPDTYTPPA